MERYAHLSIRTIVLLLVVCQLGSILATANLCSCYTFNTAARTKSGSSTYCHNKGGRLVSMETEEEYQFINTTMQNLNISNNEWRIGLNAKGTYWPPEWAWVSGHSLTIINKWLPGEPRRYGDCVKMIKDYRGIGLFDNIICSSDYMFICEYDKDQPVCGQNRSLSWCSDPTTKTTTVKHESTVTTVTTATTTTGRPTTTAPTSTSPPTSHLITSDQMSSTQQSRSTAIHDSTTTKKPQIAIDTTVAYVTTAGDVNRPRSKSQKSPESFPMVIVVAALGAVLAVTVCLLGFACYWKRRNRVDKQKTKNTGTNEVEQPSTNNPGPENGDSAEGVHLFHQNNGESYVSYAVIHNDLTKKNDQNQAQSTSNEPAYASIEDGKNMKRSGSMKNRPNVAMPTAAVGGENSGNAVGGLKSNPEVVYASVNTRKGGYQSASTEVMANNIKNGNQDGKQRHSGHQVLYASVDKSKKTKAAAEEVVYAEVGSKENAVKQQPYQITYADLADFNQNAPQEAVKPAPYQQAEYAVIIGQKQNT